MNETGALISEWMKKEDISPYLERGDLLEFRRTATIGSRERPLYAHWAIYIGKLEDVHRVVHISTDDGDFGGREGVTKLADSFPKVAKASSALVRCDTLDVVSGNDLLRINNLMDKDLRPFPPSIIVERATHSMGAGDYNIVFNNCEHFAKWARYGKKCSSQAVAAQSLVLSSVLSIVMNPAFAAGLGLLYGIMAPTVNDLVNRTMNAFK